MVDFVFLDEPVVDEASWAKAMKGDADGRARRRDRGPTPRRLGRATPSRRPPGRWARASGSTASGPRRPCGSPSRAARSGRRCSSRSRSSGGSAPSAACGRRGPAPDVAVRSVPPPAPAPPASAPRPRASSVASSGAPSWSAWSCSPTSAITVVQVWSARDGRRRPAGRRHRGARGRAVRRAALAGPRGPARPRRRAVRGRPGRPSSSSPAGAGEGDRFTEGLAGYQYLLARGVPEPRCCSRTAGRNSWQSLAAAARFLLDQGRREVAARLQPLPRPAHGAHRRRGGPRRPRLAHPLEPREGVGRS